MEQTAKIVSWAPKRFEVVCPFCDGTHIYDYKISAERRYRLVARCDSSRKTTFVTQRLPRSKYNEIYYEIDKTHFRFIPSTRLEEPLVGQSPKETDHDFGLIGGPEYVRIEHQGESTSLALTPGLYQFIRSKTFAAMRRPGGLPNVSAKSGWGHGQEGNSVISGKHWTREVMKLCDEIQYPLTPDLDRDQGNPGQHNASHVEKQLIALFIYKHMILPHELFDTEESESEDDDIAGLFGNMTLAEGNERTAKAKLRELHKSRPGRSLKRADIYVSRAVCRDCEKFSKHVQNYLGLRFNIQRVQAVPWTSSPEHKL